MAMYPMTPSALAPKCPRCNLPLDPAETAHSHDGAVHPQCVRPTDAQPPTHREASVGEFERAAPKYGGPPLRRFMRSLVLLVPPVLLLLLLVRRCR